jgi:RyR domain
MANDYHPRPLPTEGVELSDELLPLVELLAENAHDIWARQRMKDGWTFGPKRCDESLRHPCLIPYSELSDGEKVYDRNAVLETVRAIIVLGFVIEKRIPESDSSEGNAVALATER